MVISKIKNILGLIKKPKFRFLDKNLKNVKTQQKKYSKFEDSRDKLHKNILKKYNMLKLKDRNKVISDFKLGAKLINIKSKIKQIELKAKEKKDYLNNSEAIKTKFLSDLNRDIKIVYEGFKKIEEIQKEIEEKERSLINTKNRKIIKEKKKYLERLKELTTNKTSISIAKYEFYDKEFGF